MKVTGNKGEWSEIYVLLRLLQDRKLFLANEKLKKLADDCIDIFEIIWSNSNTDFITYNLRTEDAIFVTKDRKISNSIDRDLLTELTELLFQEIIENKKTTFTFSNFRKLSDNLYINRIKSPANKKNDVELVIFNERIQAEVTEGFSIKSELGGFSTIVNASKHTIFVYEVKGLNQIDIDRINSIFIERSNGKHSVDVTKRIKYIIKAGGSIIPYEMRSKVYKDNLIKVDSLLPDIISHLILESYLSGEKKLVKLSDTEVTLKSIQLSKTKIRNVLGEYLDASLFGLMPSKDWTNYHNTNGLIVAKRNGEVLTFYIYNRKHLWEYLINNCFLDTPSTSRYKTGTIYQDKDSRRCFIDLCLQVRVRQTP